MNTKIVKKYVLLLFVSLSLLVIFILLEKSNKSFKINNDKDLSAQSVKVIESLVDEKAVKFEIYSNKNSVVAKKIFKFFSRFKEINNQIIIEFIDPSTNPSKAQNNSVTIQGEIVLTFVDETRINKVNITELSETSIINAVLRLQNDKDEWMVIAEGYGMRSIDDDTSQGLSKLLLNLKKIGFHIARMPLNTALVLPEKVKVIALPHPKEQLDEQMVAWLLRQSESGISIWWLYDVDSVAQPYLELAFDVLIGEKKKLDGDEYSAVLSGFPQHKIVENFNQPIYLAESVEIISSNSQVFIQTSEKESLAISKKSSSNRLVISGDTDFVSNQYINAAANSSLSIRIVDWLFYHDDRINVPVKVNKNTQLLLTKSQLLILSVLFLILIPLFFMIVAFKQWRKNRA